MSLVDDEIVASPRGATREIRRLSSLIDISQALSGTLNLSAALPQALDILERHHQVVRSAVTLIDEDGELIIRASTGLSAEGQRARYRLGEGITGRVVESG
jgi:Nif-specific regulatory protein